MSLEKKAIVGTIWQSGISWISFAINFCINLALVRILFPVDYGVYAMGASFAEIFLIFFGFSYGMAVVQMEDKDDLFETALSLSIITGLIIIIGSIIIGLLLANHLSLKSTFVFILVCCLSSINICASVFSSVSEKELKMFENSIVRGTASVTAGTISLIFALNGFGIWALAIKDMSYSIIMLFGMMKVASTKYTFKFNLTTAKKIMLFSVKGLFARGAEIAIYRIPSLFIGAFIGMKELGFYSQVQYLINLPNLFFASATQSVAYPFYSKINDQKEKILKSFKMISYFMLRILAPLAVICAIFPTEVIFIVFGNKWAGAAGYLRGLTLLMYFMPILNNIKTITYSINKIEYAIKAYVIGILLTVAAMLCERYLVRGSFVTLYSISSVSIIFFMINYLRADKIFISLKEIFCLPTLLTIISLVIAYSINTNYVWNISVIAKAIIMLTMYLLILAFLFLHELETAKEYYRLITRKLKTTNN